MDHFGGEVSWPGGKGGTYGPATSGEQVLPYARSFLVQFTADTDTGLRRAAGRVEHVSSGRRSPFTSIDSLCASIAAVLAATADVDARGAGRDDGEKAPGADAEAGSAVAKPATRQSRPDRTRARRTPAPPAGAAPRPGKKTGRK